MLTVSLTFALLLLPNVAFAYECDTHYVLTYYLARKVGFSPDEAQRIASATLAVDTSPDTEPFQLGKVINPFGDAQTPRGRFHAFLDSRAYDDAYERARFTPGNSPADTDAIATKAAMAQRIERGRRLWQDGVRSGNPGPFLHFFEDLFAHDGFYTFWGHMSAGNAQDYLANDPRRASAMAEAATAALQEYMRALGRQPRQLSTSDLQDITTLLGDLEAANPSPAPTLNPLTWVPGVIENWLASLWGGGVPDCHRALQVMQQRLGEPVPVDPIRYILDPDGRPIRDADWSVRNLPNGDVASTSSMGTGASSTCPSGGGGSIVGVLDDVDQQIAGGCSSTGTDSTSAPTSPAPTVTSGPQFVVVRTGKPQKLHLRRPVHSVAGPDPALLQVAQLGGNELELIGLKSGEGLNVVVTYDDGSQDTLRADVLGR